MQYHRLNPALAASASDWLQPGQELRLDLLEDQDIIVAVEGVTSTVDGGWVVHGRATTDEASTVTLTLQGRELTGMIRLSGLGHFRLVPVDEGGLHEVRQLATRPPVHCATGWLPRVDDARPALARAGVALHALDLPPADTLPEPTVVDVLFLFEILPDDLEEGEERIRLGFGSVTGMHGLGQQSRSEVVILDADIPPAFANIEFPEGPLSVVESGGEARINVRLAGHDSGLPLTLPYQTVEGSDRHRAARSRWHAGHRFRSWTGSGHVPRHVCRTCRVRTAVRSSGMHGNGRFEHDRTHRTRYKARFEDEYEYRPSG
ncbi:MAG: hypothetical protein KF833_13235 [Verrucomicrobiae bacterium]|nr:hypothetical protein [Verrucomicrobiae bacterium]